MFDALIAGALFAVVAPAEAAPVTVWLREEAPDERTIQRADLQTGGTTHLWNVDLRYPPSPETAADGERIAQLPVAVENGIARWEEFEIELAIARDLQMVVDDVTLLRADRDRTDLADALLFQGAAVARAFDPREFGTDDRAAAFRYQAGDAVAPRAWVDAFALTGKLADRSKLPDGTAWQDYQRFAPAIEKLAAATLTVDAVPGGEVFVDGAKVETGPLSLRPGRHWIHVVRGGVVHGRTVLDARPSETYAFPRAVTDAEIAATVEKVAAGRATGLPEAVAAALDDLDRFHKGGPMFLGVDDGKRFTVVSYDGKAVLKDTRLVTAVLYAEVGGGVLATPLFDQNETPGALYVAAGASGGLGFEVGVSYFAFGGGIDAAFTPTNTIQFAAGSSDTPDANTAVSVFPQPHFEIGAYALRPTKPAPTFVILGGFTWLAPAHLAYGGRLSVGIPLKNEHTWVRLSAGGYYGPTALAGWPDDTPAVSAFLRVGFGAKP